MRGGRVQVLGVGGLDPESMRRLVNATAGGPVSGALVDAIGAETDGNPFFAREIVAHLREDRRLHRGPDGALGASLPLSTVPEGVRQVIARRRRPARAADEPSPRRRRAGRGSLPLRPRPAGRGLREPEGLLALDEALQADLIAPGGVPDRYEFTHALIRHAVLGELNPSRRLRLHRELAVALADARRDGVRVGAGDVAIQYHHAASLPGAEAGVTYAVEAADRAGSLGAHDERATFLRIALDLIPADDDRRAGLFARRAEALAWALRFDEAVEDARVAVAAGAPPVTWAELATVLAAAGSATHAWELAAEVMAAPGRIDRERWASMTLLDLERREAADPDHPGMPLDLPGRRAALRTLHHSGHLARRGDLARYALAAVYGCRDRIPAETAVDPTVAAFLLGDYARAVPRFARDADAAEADGRLAWAVYCRAGQARCQVALGSIAEGVVALGQARAMVARLPGLPLGWQLSTTRGPRTPWSPRWTKAGPSAWSGSPGGCAPPRSGTGAVRASRASARADTLGWAGPTRRCASSTAPSWPFTALRPGRPTTPAPPTRSRRRCGSCSGATISPSWSAHCATGHSRPTSGSR